MPSKFNPNHSHLHHSEPIPTTTTVNSSSQLPIPPHHHHHEPIDALIPITKNHSKTHQTHNPCPSNPHHHHQNTTSQLTHPSQQPPQSTPPPPQSYLAKPATYPVTTMTHNLNHNPQPPLLHPKC